MIAACVIWAAVIAIGLIAGQKGSQLQVRNSAAGSGSRSINRMMRLDAKAFPAEAQPGARSGIGGIGCGLGRPWCGCGFFSGGCTGKERDTEESHNLFRASAEVWWSSMGHSATVAAAVQPSISARKASGRRFGSGVKRDVGWTRRFVFAGVMAGTVWTGVPLRF